MDQLWAPWRMTYIEDTTPQEGCIFCTKGTDDADESNHIVYRAPNCYVMLNLYPYNSGHLMVIPYVHVGKIAELHPTIGAEIFVVLQLATRVLEDTMKPEGFNIGVNQAKVAGAGVADHVHVHVVPRWNGDTNFMPVLADTKVMPESLDSTASKLRSRFARYQRDE